MIIKKMNINGEEIHVQLTYEEALKRKDEADTFIFSDQEESVCFFHDIETKNEHEGQEKATSSKQAHILKMLPFLDDEEIHEIYVKILEKDPIYKDLNITVLLPFLDDEDVDKLFLEAIKDKTLNVHYMSIAPFVSDETLKTLVDLYIRGDLEDIDMNHLYPFLDSKDIKRLFEYYLKQ